MHKPMTPVTAQMNQLELQQAALEGLALPHDLAVQTAPFYQPGFSKQQNQKWVWKQATVNVKVTSTYAPRKFLFPSSHCLHHEHAFSSFTPTSVIQKMCESREKSKEEIAPGTMVPGDGKEHTWKASEENLLSSIPYPVLIKTLLRQILNFRHYSGLHAPPHCLRPTVITKDQDYQPKAAGRKTSIYLGISSPRNTFSPPYPPSPPHPSCSYSTCAPASPRISPKVNSPRASSTASSMFAPSWCASSWDRHGSFTGTLQPTRGSTLVPLVSAVSHPFLNPRPETPLHLAVMQQQLQHSVLHPPGSSSQAAAINVQTPQNVPQAGQASPHALPTGALH